jgi:hypothetical protein
MIRKVSNEFCQQTRVCARVPGFRRTSQIHFEQNRMALFESGSASDLIEDIIQIFIASG